MLLALAGAGQRARVQGAAKLHQSALHLRQGTLAPGHEVASIRATSVRVVTPQGH